MSRGPGTGGRSTILPSLVARTDRHLYLPHQAGEDMARSLLVVCRGHRLVVQIAADISRTKRAHQTKLSMSADGSVCTLVSTAARARNNDEKSSTQQRAYTSP